LSTTSFRLNNIIIVNELNRYSTVNSTTTTTPISYSTLERLD